MLSQIYKGSIAVSEPVLVDSGSYNARSGIYYIATGFITNFIDPPNPGVGDGYIVLAAGNSTVLGGQSFPQRTLLYRFFNGQWSTSAYVSASATHATALSNFLQNPTSDNLALLLTNENGTGGGFVRSEGATLVNPTIIGYTEGSINIGNSGASVNISLVSGTILDVVLTANCIFNMPPVGFGRSFTMLLRTGAGGFSPTFPGVRWPNGTAPVFTTTSNRLNILGFISDGSFWYGSLTPNFLL